MTQRQAILDYMRTHDCITPMQAFSELGVTKLATQISYMIRYEGLKVKKELITTKNRYGQHTSFMKYSLIEGEKES